MLGLIYRTCTNERRCWLFLNPTQLEYASRVWSHYTKRKIMAIERVQRRATKFILRCDFSITYPERLVKLGLLPLEFKREVIDLWFVFTSLWTYLTLTFSHMLVSSPLGITWETQKQYFLRVALEQMFLNFHFLIAL